MKWNVAMFTYCKHKVNSQNFQILDAYDCITVLLLVHIWPSALLRLPNGKKWKPSLQESCEGIVLHLKSLADYETELARLSKQNALRGLQDFPVVVAVGESIISVSLFFVSYRDISYKAETFLKALDISFKIFKTYGLCFPFEAAGPWSFIAYYAYDFAPPTDNNNARVYSLIRTLREHSAAQ